MSLRSDPIFPTDTVAIEARIDAIDPRAYSATRNHVDGAVTRLSPYITHGVIDPRQVAERVVERHGAAVCEKLVYELAWRDYHHHVWWERGDGILQDLRRPQEAVHGRGVPTSVLRAATGIYAIDEQLRALVDVGYVHNHARMWIAALVATIARAPWRDAAEWMHYHLLDGDLASNHLSWQWVAGTSRAKRYVADQRNVDRFGTSPPQAGSGTALDMPYEELGHRPVPPELSERTIVELPVPALPEATLRGAVNEGEDVLLYHPYTLTRQWHADAPGKATRRILVIEPGLLAARPLAPQRMRFIMQLAAEIPELEVHVGEVSEIACLDRAQSVRARAHPYTRNWPATLEPPLRVVPQAETRSLNSFSAWFGHARRHLERDGLMVRRPAKQRTLF
jgi:deoxyribodipyrimidine photo-lyase